MYKFIYNFIFIPLLIFLSKILMFFVPKIRERELGIKNSLENLDKIKINQKVIWVHAASMGEFEQAKPIIEQIKKLNNNIQFVCTFFSPSGYNTQKNYQFASAVTYLPIDTKKNAKYFINKIKPDIAIFIRYELWLNYLTILNENSIPTILINATFPTILNKIHFLSKFYKQIFNLFNAIYVVNSKHYDKYLTLNLKTMLYKSSDTRIERIIKKVEESKSSPILYREYFPKNNIIFVIGSSWEKDEEYVIKAVNNINKKNNNIINLIIVPHEPTKKNVENIIKKLDKYILFSDIKKEGNNIIPIKITDEVIIIDTIGILLKIYGIADIAYVGGSFGVGVHSLIEPAGYGIPICTGKNCFNSPDAVPLIESNALYVIENEFDLEYWLNEIIKNKEYREIASQSAKNYIFINSGATQTIINEIKKYISIVTR